MPAGPERFPTIDGRPVLTIELVPATAWWTNVRSNVSRAEWEKCKRFTATRAHGVCEICGRVGRRHPVECHEIWHYDDERGIQTLVDLIALCPACHEVKHIGRAMNIGRGDRAAAHLMEVNGWSRAKAEQAIYLAFQIWNLRSQMEWALNIDWLKNLGIHASVTDRG